MLEVLRDEETLGKNQKEEETLEKDVYEYGQLIKKELLGMITKFEVVQNEKWCRLDRELHGTQEKLTAAEEKNEELEKRNSRLEHNVEELKAEISVLEIRVSGNMKDQLGQHLARNIGRAAMIDPVEGIEVIRQVNPQRFIGEVIILPCG